MPHLNDRGSPMKRPKIEDVELLDDDQILITFADASVAVLRADELLTFARERHKLTKVKGDSDE